MVDAKVQSRSCPLCQGKHYLLKRQGDRAVASICSCSSVCQICDGSGYVLTTRDETFSKKMGQKTYDVLASCMCRLLKTRVRRFSEAGVPGVLAHADFENYNAAVAGQDRAKRTAMDFALTFRKGEGKRGFILAGPVGTGKTHLMTAALAHLILEGGVEARYVEISLLFATIRRGFNEGKSGGEIIGPLSDVEVLAIDELGKGRGSPFELETLDELIARRYNAGRTTLLATNYSLDPDRKAGAATAKGYRSAEETKAATREQEVLKDRVGERIYSRLCEMCDFLQLPPDAPDYRRARQDVVSRPLKTRAAS